MMIRVNQTAISRLASLCFSASLLAATSSGALANNQNGFKLAIPTVSEELKIEGRHIKIDEVSMHYLEQGNGDPILFIHGNPTSSYIWRNIIPYVSDDGRAIALDLVGMGHSSKPNIKYTYSNHYSYLDKFVRKMGLTNITLVVHDWGATLGFDLARRNPGLIKRIAFMEGILPPLFPQPSYTAMGPEMGEMFQSLRDPVKGKQMVVENNIFIEQILPNFVNRPLGEIAMTTYREPFMDKSSREVVLAWPRELPIGGLPKENEDLLNDLKSFMASFNKPALLLYADPGVLVPPNLVPFYQKLMPNLEAQYVGQGFHFIQEDNPDAIGRALSDWIRRT